MIETPCRHHWLIQEPRSRYSPGRCKLCGKESMFDNWPDSERVHGYGAAYRVMADNTFQASGSPSARHRRKQREVGAVALDKACQQGVK